MRNRPKDECFHHNLFNMDQTHPSGSKTNSGREEFKEYFTLEGAVPWQWQLCMSDYQLVVCVNIYIPCGYTSRVRRSSLNLIYRCFPFVTKKIIS